ncbi:MAG: cupin domain-containing protein [Thermoflexales bacterium]|nr:cupin domain-containing protein [Thermoflexales bacterium]
MSSKGLTAATRHPLATLVAYGDSAVVSRALMAGPAGTVTAFAFDGGESLSEHSAPYDALVQVLEGEAGITIAGKRQVVPAGEVILLPANVPHAVDAPGRFKMLLTMIRA